MVLSCRSFSLHTWQTHHRIPGMEWVERCWGTDRAGHHPQARGRRFPAQRRGHAAAEKDRHFRQTKNGVEQPTCGRHFVHAQPAPDPPGPQAEKRARGGQERDQTGRFWALLSEISERICFQRHSQVRSTGVCAICCGPEQKPKTQNYRVSSNCSFALVICPSASYVAYHMQVTNDAFVRRVLVRSCCSFPFFGAQLVGKCEPIIEETAAVTQHWGARAPGEGDAQRTRGPAAIAEDCATNTQNAGLRAEEAASCTGLCVRTLRSLSRRLALGALLENMIEDPTRWFFLG